MVTTRKKPRISYQEIAKSDDEDEQAPVAESSTSGAKASTSYTRTYRNATATASTSTAAAATATSAATTASASASVEPEPEDDHDDGDGEFQLTGRNYRKKGRKQQKRKSGSVGPKKPVFDHSKILELPADVLCTILSHLPLENLFTLSISSRKFSTFLHSKTCASIWIDARKRLTVYAPKAFLNPKDYGTRPPQDPLCHFPFTEVERAPGEGYDDVLEEEMNAFEKKEGKLPIAVPAPPPGRSEFSMVRYLFCNICYHCGKEGRASMIKVPELMAHFCKPCWTSHTGSYKTAMNDFEDTLDAANFTEIPLYTQFLLTQPAWKAVHHELNYDRAAPLLPKERRIYLPALAERYKDFKAKKEAMTAEEFDTWFTKAIQDQDEARKQVGSLSEYLWLKSTHSSYSYRMNRAIYERNEKALKEAVIERMGVDDTKVRKNVETVLNIHTTLLFSLPRTSRNLEDSDWLKIEPDLRKYLQAYTAWVDSNPLCQYPDLTSCVSSQVNLLMYDTLLASASRLQYHESLYFTLPTVKQFLLNAPDDLDNVERRTWIRTRFTEERAAIISDLTALRTRIQKDLVRKWLLAEDKSVASLDEWSNAKMQEILDRPEVYFICTSCDAQHIATWTQIAAHACISNDKGERYYRNRERGIQDSTCIPCGWQSDRIELAGGFKGLHDLLETIARAKHTESVVSATRNPFVFPSSHSALVNDTRWFFECKVEGCNIGYQRLSATLLHLAKHVREGKAILQQLSEDYKPVAKAPTYSTYDSMPAYLYGGISDEEMHSDYEHEFD
ncbi:hypothetical protein P389DRAFT_174019 [Cystobasidium minutum MCA 4210]|uniref:uncharacterized protein n=1 Tax=Cystobasidium minutum MCA 4210 TaxID=1397322 RepID=UPI0034CE25C0|eukprot:jgi/Rhomi1/174019/fgenesh1_kg.7_\